ncbi:MAG: hypothetical protein CMO81_07345 [Waddliaceae bacterium]|nr:hypothetical protein [Waddliaceae bacterium]
MKGTIFNYLEEFVSKNHGEDSWISLIENTELETEDAIFVGPGNYPDKDLFALAQTASEMLKTPIEDILHSFGYFVLEKFSVDFPIFFEKVSSAKDFLSSIHCVIHVEVKKLYPDAETPDFEYETPGNDELVMSYYSSRKLCIFLRGLLDGVADYFKEKIDYIETQCMHQGGDHCKFHLTFSGVKNG